MRWALRIWLRVGVGDHGQVKVSMEVGGETHPGEGGEGGLGW